MKTMAMRHRTIESLPGGSSTNDPYDMRVMLRQFALRGRDPAVADENLYRYCVDTPTDATDPTGKMQLTDLSYASRPKLLPFAYSVQLTYTFGQPALGMIWTQSQTYSVELFDKDNTKTPRVTLTATLLDMSEIKNTTMPDYWQFDSMNIAQGLKLAREKQVPGMQDAHLCSFKLKLAGSTGIVPADDLKVRWQKNNETFAGSYSDFVKEFPGLTDSQVSSYADWHFDLGNGLGKGEGAVESGYTNWDKYPVYRISSTAYYNIGSYEYTVEGTILDATMLKQKASGIKWQGQSGQHYIKNLTTPDVAERLFVLTPDLALW